MGGNLARLSQRFVADPSDAAAFAALEEHYFLEGSWTDLVRLYERRLEAPDLEEDLAGRAQVLFRLGQVFEERCDDLDGAVRCYRDAARLVPNSRPALSQLRRVHATRGQWDLVLQVAEVEAAFPMQPFERAAFEADLAAVWHRQLGDPAEALVHFERALEADPTHPGALRGLAGLQAERGEVGAAAANLEQAAGRLQGPERAEVLVAWARLLEGSDAERAGELWRRAVEDDPRSEDAARGALGVALGLERWSEAAKLYERLFHLVAGARRRLAVAQDAGRLQLERLRDPQGARLWFGRALELFPDDPAVHLNLAEVEGLAGNREARFRHLDRAAAMDEQAIPADALLECAASARERGDDRSALAHLRRALQCAPDRADVIEELAAALERQGHDDELVEILERHAALAGDTSTPALWMRLGAVHERRGDEESALEAYERAAESDPDAADPAALERLYRKTGAWAKLRAILEAESRGHGRRAVSAHCGLGELLLEQFRDVDGARLAFEAALVLDATHERALRGLERVALSSGDDGAILDAYQREAGITTDRGRLAWLVGELVRLLEARDESEQALMWVDRLVAVAPEDRWGLETRARLQESLGHDAELVETLERLDPAVQGAEQAALRRRRARLLEGLGERPQAVTAWRAVLAVMPEDVAALRALEQLLEADGRLGELADVRRELCELLPESERSACLAALADLLAGPLGLPDAALEVLGRVDAGAPPSPEVERRHLDLLERTERFDELEQRLAARAAHLAAGSPELVALSLRRAALLVERLGRPAEAAALLEDTRRHDPRNEALASLLDAALRAAGDQGRLADHLAARARTAAQPEPRAALLLERAQLLESPALDREDEARALYAELAEEGGPAAAEADARLEALLERAGDYDQLRERLERRLARGEDLDLRQRLAALCRDRLLDPEGAIHHLEAAAALDSQCAVVWQSLARLYGEEQRPGDVLRAILGELEAGADREREILLRARAAQLCREELDDAEGACVQYARLLELEPGHSAAAEFLTDRLILEGRHADLLAVLERRLGATLRAADGAGAGRDAETSLRLRIASLRSGPLGDPEAAIAVLMPVAERPETLGVAAEPLADLYQRTGRREDLIALCRRAAAACETPEERATWSLRLGDALRAEGGESASAEAYRQVLADRPGDLDAESALRDLYRRLGEADPLARLLEAELSRMGGAEEIPVRLELAALLAERLDRPEDALLHLRRVLQVDPGNVAALARALNLTQQLDRHEDRLQLLDLALARTRSGRTRARHLVERARLLAGPLGRPEDAVEGLREALDLDPGNRPVRAQLRALLESRGDWAGVVECLEDEARSLPPGLRVPLYEEAARIAAERLSADASLPWLERLRILRPDDASLPARIAALHRAADRTEDWLRASEAELALAPDAERRCALELERAELFEKRLGAPGRAVASLESARASDPRAREVLRRLARLYEVTDRRPERAEVLEELIAEARGPERIALRRQAAALWGDLLADPQRAADHLWAALQEVEGSGGVERIELLGHLGAVFRAMGRSDLWARVAEEELRSLDPQEVVFAERRQGLHRDLARSYSRELGQSDRALGHWRALVEGATAGESLEAELAEEAERGLLDGLRAARNDVELERRLAARLARHPADAALWLELGRLRAERLHRPARAAEAFREVLLREPHSLSAIRGLRAVSERLGHWEEAARTLEMELELPEGRGALERAALQRRLGEIAWRHLDSTTLASRAFASALEADPRDLVALRSLETLFETMEDWRGAIDLYESEIEVLGEDDADRRREVWLRVAELCRDRLGDRTRALRACEEAAALGRLPAPKRLEWAELLEAAGERERFADVFAAWCDDPGAEASADDHLRLCASLEELGRAEAALARAERACEVDASCRGAWDAVARLREDAGDVHGAAAALERAASLVGGGDASARLRRAAALVEPDLGRAAELLGRAVEQDPADPASHALLARVTDRLGDPRRTEAAAEHALDLAGAGAPLDRDLQLGAALAGARAARSLEHHEAAARFYASALRFEPEHPEALSGQGEVLVALGDGAGARRALEARLALAEDDPRRAEHLALLATALEAEGEAQKALERYREALALDGGLDRAHAGLTGLLERSGRREEAVDAFQAWAAASPEPSLRAERLLRAGEIELGVEGHSAEAEQLLREAVAVDPALPRAWRLLAELLWQEGREGEAHETAVRGLAAAGDSPEAACLHAVRARALEARGERGAAADSFRAAAEANPTDVSSALSCARLLRALGEWRAAAEILRRFVNHHPGSDPRALAPALDQLARLLAGPLEDVGGAIEVYRRALKADPDLRQARETLSDLLVHRPDLWREALERHRELLDQDPTRVTSLRGIVRIARTRQDARGVAMGCAILRALGAASSDELREAPESLPLRSLEDPDLGSPLWEAVRRLAQEAAPELGEALGAGFTLAGPPGASGDPVGRFRSAAVAAEGRLSAPALVPMDTPLLAQTMELLAALTLEEEEVRGDGHVVNALARQLGRRSRRRLRRLLEGRSALEVTGIDWEAWRTELRGLAALVALVDTGLPLRSAFLALLRGEDSEAAAIPPEADIRALVAASPDACALLRRLIAQWTGTL